uniref:Glycosyltransferase 25 family member n=1 Tax=Syphacia muris TaxID=451379 RepID=A0A0N5A8V0_9BILA
MGIVLNVVVLSTFLLDVLRFTNSLSAKPLPNFCPGNDECQAFYPLITFSFYLDEDVHIIPFFFGYLENIDYPKDRIILDIYVNNETNYTFDRTNLPLLINLKHPNVSSATFSMKYVSNCAGIINPVNAFLFSLSRMELTVHIDHSNFYGVHIACRSSLLGNEWKQVIIIMETDLTLLKLFGFDYQLWEATDGKNLENEPLFNEIKLLDNYEDPYFKRPMKAGEVGCFLSHYRIWKDVILNNYSRIIVFEDDLRFSITGINRLSELIEDLDSQHFQWDFVYLGRKKLAGDNEKWFFIGIRHLSTVSYSYWTIGYMLSYSGAQKLLQNNPLKKLLPVDEYIPIMFNQHPNSTWMEMFKKRDLSAFTVFPLIVHPEKYTVDIGYVSDTEDSPVITNYKF